MQKLNIKTLGFLVGMACLAMAGSASAQDSTLTADQIIEALDPVSGSAEAPALDTLGRSFGTGKTARRRVDLTIFFDPDSARINRRSAVQLEPLARALQSRRLARLGFTIIGHTDASGEPAYNRKLSLRRAQAVRAHLAQVYRINTRRLAVKGLGSDQLKDRGDPASDINRRVEVAANPRKARL